MTMAFVARDAGTSAARRRRERRLRSMLRHERMTVRMELAAALHHSWGGGLVTHDGPRAQKTASAGLAEYFELSSDDGRPAGGERPAALLEPRPQERDRRHTGVGYEIAQNLEVPVPQMGEQLPAAQLPVVAEPVIDVPKILPQVIPLRRRRRRTQLAEQLVHVPTVVSYSSLQQLTAEQIVDIPVPGGGGGRGSLQGSRVRPRPNRAAYCGADSRAEDRFPRQNPAADVGQFPDIPARRGLSDFLPGQGSSASSSGLHDGADDGIQGFFRTFPRHKKSPKPVRSPSAELLREVSSSLGPRVHARSSLWTPSAVPARVRPTSRRRFRYVAGNGSWSSLVRGLTSGTVVRVRRAWKWRRAAWLAGCCGPMASMSWFGMVRSTSRSTTCDWGKGLGSSTEWWTFPFFSVTLPTVQPVQKTSRSYRCCSWTRLVARCCTRQVLWFRPAENCGSSTVAVL